MQKIYISLSTLFSVQYLWTFQVTVYSTCLDCSTANAFLLSSIYYARMLALSIDMQTDIHLMASFPGQPG